MAACCSLSILSLGVLFLAWWINSCSQPAASYDRPPVTNADGSVYFDHRHLLRPSSVPEIIEIVKSAHHDRRKVKVLGAGHSRSAIAHSSDIYISLYSYRGVVHTDHQRKQVTVRAGTLLKDLNTELRQNGLALSSLPTLSEQTIGGALAVGSHGTGLEYGNMATFVTSISFVSGTGELISVNASTDSELFKATLVSLGMIGVVTDVTFQCEEWFNLKEKISIHSIDECLGTLHTLVTRSDHGKLWLQANSGVCAVFDVWRTRQSATPSQGVTVWDTKNRITEPLMWFGSWIPSVNPPLMTFLYKDLHLFTPYERVAASHDVFIPSLYVPANNQLEVVVDVKDCAAALTEWRGLAINDHHTNLFTEVRYVKADDIFLSPNYNRDSCHITIIIYNSSHQVMLNYFQSVCDSLSRFSPRMHWAKYSCGLNRRKVELLYPRVTDFARIRKKMDPRAIFINHALRETFGFSEQ